MNGSAFFSYVCVSRSMSLALKCGFGTDLVLFSKHKDKNLASLAVLHFPDSVFFWFFFSIPLGRSLFPLIDLTSLHICTSASPSSLSMLVLTHYFHFVICVLNTSLSTKYSKSRTSADSFQPTALPCVAFQSWQYYCVLSTLDCSPHKGTFISWTTEVWIVQILSLMNSFSVLWRNRPYVRNNYEHWVGLYPDHDGKVTAWDISG